MEGNVGPTVDSGRKACHASVCSFSLLFAYVLSFFFEGEAFYSLTEGSLWGSETLLFAAVISHLAGLLLGFLFVKDLVHAKRAMTLTGAASLLLTLPFFFEQTLLWLPLIAAIGFLCGISVASWGWFLRICAQRLGGLRVCADVLIYSNLVMTAANTATLHVSGKAGLAIAVAALALSVFFALSPAVSGGDERAPGAYTDVSSPLFFLCLFVATITIDSGLMYQVFNPAFESLSWLASWYWAVPYMAALVVMRFLPVGAHRAKFLYLGIAMIILSFVCFAVAGRGAAGYLVVDTLMLGACGIFDLFWWSIAAEMLCCAKNPAKVFGFCLAANVGGVLMGDAAGFLLRTFAVSAPNVAVIALIIVCVTTALLPPLNVKLLSLLKEHTYLYSFPQLPRQEREKALDAASEQLSVREKEVLGLLTSGLTNRQIAESLCVSENTVKFHVKNIYSKFEVTSRAGLLAKILKK